MNFSLYSPIHPLIIFPLLKPQKNPGGHHPDEANRDPAAADAFRPRPQWRTHAVSSLWANCLPLGPGVLSLPSASLYPLGSPREAARPIVSRVICFGAGVLGQNAPGWRRRRRFPDRARPSLTRQREPRRRTLTCLGGRQKGPRLSSFGNRKEGKKRSKSPCRGTKIALFYATAQRHATASSGPAAAAGKG